jgi:hypothetical protein
MRDRDQGIGVLKARSDKGGHEGSPAVSWTSGGRVGDERMVLGGPDSEFLPVVNDHRWPRHRDESDLKPRSRNVLLGCVCSCRSVHIPGMLLAHRKFSGL